MRTVLKSWGREEIFVESPYCVKKLVYEHEGIASSLHYHEHKHETFTILEGLFEISTRRPSPKGAEILHRRYFSAGEVIEIPPGTQHQVCWLGQSEQGRDPGVFDGGCSRGLRSYYAVRDSADEG